MKLVFHAALVIFVVFAIFAIKSPPKIGFYFNAGLKLGQLNLSNLSQNEGTALATAAYNQPVYININNKSFRTDLNELGYTLNQDYLSKLTKKCLKFGVLICVPSKTAKFDQTRVFGFNPKKSQKLTQKINNQLLVQKNEPNVDFITGEFWILTEKASIQAKSDFAHDLNLQRDFGKKLFIKVKPIEKDNFADQQQLMYEHVAKVNSPLLIKYGRNPLYISTEEINTFITKNQTEDITHAKVSINKIAHYLDTLDEKYATEDIQVVRPEAEEAIARSILYRAADTKENTAVVLPLQGLPKSRGEKATKYLEVIKSQQRLYRFEDGELVKTYIVSTGIVAETPTGEFKVLGKQKKTISYFGNWWMENYLPIGYMPNGNRFGFHAIPYHQDSSGAVWSRDPNTMGSPATSGCIQLTQVESLELYEWAKVGMPVFIYE